MFDSLCQVKPKNKKINISNNDFVFIGGLQLLEKIFVEPNRDATAHYGKSQLNYILKNNFHNGSYIFDFFDRTKEYCNFLLKKSELLNTFNEKLNKIIPIQIGNVSDRLGNIIFQLPINAINIHIDSEKIGDDINFRNTINVKINCLNNKVNSKDFVINLSEEKDGETINHAISENTLSTTSKNFTSPTITITHKDSGLIFYKKQDFYIKQMYFNINLVGNKQRKFIINGKNNIFNIHTSCGTNRSSLIKDDYLDFIDSRKYEQDKKQLENQKKFIQYFKGDRNKALQDIRELINKDNYIGIYLWDPYLSAIDIKETLYYCKNTNTHIKAIAGLRQNRNKWQTISDMKDEFNKDNKNELFLNIEIRATYNHGYDFHDRFLIFETDKYHKTIAYSLGTSINQLGNTHHIIQEVNNAQHILNAFNKLWGKLEYEECIVWKNL